MIAEKGNFYFIKDKYFKDFPDKKLMINKEKINGVEHNRPCYYNFYDANTSIKWLIPVSSQVEKYEDVYSDLIKKSKNGECDTIVFGYILGKKCAFLIQNMCPIIDDYINNIYIDKAINRPVIITEKTKKELNSKARKVLALYKKKGVPLILPNVRRIEQSLIEILKQRDEAAPTEEQN